MRRMGARKRERHRLRISAATGQIFRAAPRGQFMPFSVLTPIPSTGPSPFAALLPIFAYGGVRMEPRSVGREPTPSAYTVRSTVMRHAPHAEADPVRALPADVALHVVDSEIPGWVYGSVSRFQASGAFLPHLEGYLKIEDLTAIPPARTGQLRAAPRPGIDLTAPVVDVRAAPRPFDPIAPAFPQNWILRPGITRPLRHGQDLKGRVEYAGSSHDQVQSFLRSAGFDVRAVYMNAAEAQASDAITLPGSLASPTPASRWFSARWRGGNNTRTLPPQIIHLWPVVDSSVSVPPVGIQPFPPAYDIVAPLRRWHPPPGTRAVLQAPSPWPGVNLRAAPNPNAARVGGVDNGTTVTVISSNILEEGKTASHPDRWWQVHSPNGVGYLKVVDWDGQWLVTWSVPASEGEPDQRRSAGTGQLRMAPRGDIVAPAVDVRAAPRFDPVRPPELDENVFGDPSSYVCGRNGCRLRPAPGRPEVIAHIPSGFPLTILRNFWSPGFSIWFFVRAPTFLAVQNEGWIPDRELAFHS